MNIVSVSATEPGRVLAERLPFPNLHGSAGDTLRSRWHEVDGFVVFLAVGAAVRIMANLLSDKSQDPAVVCVDDAGRFAVVVCGGHAGGGNRIATQVAGILGAEPVITTATDRLDLPALDMLPGFKATGDVAGVTSAMISGQILELRNPLGWPMPAPLAAHLSESPDKATSNTLVVVTDRTLERTAKETEEIRTRPAQRVVALHPSSLVVGIGTSSDAGAEDSWNLLKKVMEEAGHSMESIGLVASVDRRRDHSAVKELAERLGVRLITYSPASLREVDVPNPSDQVEKAVGTRSVAEAAALLGAGTTAHLVVPKTTSPRVAIAIARRSRPAGSLAIVGLGPGSPEHRTPAAERAVHHADAVVGYSAYIDQCRDLLGPAQQVLEFPLGAELERAKMALQLASQGLRVALVCSGDAGTYAMASPVLEIAGSPSGNGGLSLAGIEIEVVPGVNAGSAAAALLGAPLGHDHLVISLSDLHTPWETIEKRITAAALTDLALVIYNPRSKKRTWQIEKVKSLLLEHRPATTPVGLVTDAQREGQHLVLTSLGEMDCETITMTTCVIVGSSTTRSMNGRMVTPRGYRQ